MCRLRSALTDYLSSHDFQLRYFSGSSFRLYGLEEIG